MSAPPSPPTPLTLELAGGLELLFGNVRSFALALPSSPPPTLRAVVAHARDALLVERAELFAAGEGVRAGILVLLNEVDWELVGGLDAEVAPGDTVLFISTLHGG